MLPEYSSVCSILLALIGDVLIKTPLVTLYIEPFTNECDKYIDYYGLGVDVGMKSIFARDRVTDLIGRLRTSIEPIIHVFNLIEDEV